MQPRDEAVMFGGQNNSKISLKFCIIIKSDIQKTFAIVLSINIAAVTSGASYQLCVMWNGRPQHFKFSQFDIVVSQSVQSRWR